MCRHPKRPAQPLTGRLKIESAGSLMISDGVISDQDISVRSTAGELVFSNTKITADRTIAVSSPRKIRFENSSQLAAMTAVIMQGGGTAALEVVNSTVTSPNGQILWTNSIGSQLRVPH